MGRGNVGDTDNSNTQFAILALLAASKKKYDIPMERPFALMVMRFSTSQNEDGSWTYRYHKGGFKGEEIKVKMKEHEPMTGVGLLGLAVGHGLATDVWTQVAGAERVKVEMKDKVHDDMVSKGMNAFSKHIMPVAKPKEPGDPADKDFVMRNLYYLWTVERVAVLFQQSKIVDKDWYPLGAEFLLASQQPEGSWKDGKYFDSREMTDTCLALLFLKRVNLAKEPDGEVAAIPPRSLIDAAHSL